MASTPALASSPAIHQRLGGKAGVGLLPTLIIYAACFVVALPIRVSQIFFTYKLGIIWPMACNR